MRAGAPHLTIADGLATQRVDDALDEGAAHFGDGVERHSA
jgi:hypothetical protein